MVVQQIEASMSRQPCKVYIGNPCFGNNPNPRLSSIKCQLIAEMNPPNVPREVGWSGQPVNTLL